MRKWVLAATLIAAAIWHPAAHADARLKAYVKAMPASQVCLFLKYNVDDDGYQTAVSTYAQKVADRDPEGAKADMALIHAVTDDFQADIAELRRHTGDPEGNLAAIDHLFQKYNPQCQALIKDPNFAAYFKPSRFSQSGQPQTTLNWLKYYANTGDLLTMIQMARLSFNGVGGVPKDRVAAAKWCYLVRMLDPDAASNVAKLESQLTPAERAAGKKAGDAWIDAHT